MFFFRKSGNIQDGSQESKSTCLPFQRSFFQEVITYREANQAWRSQSWNWTWVHWSAWTWFGALTHGPSRKLGTCQIRLFQREHHPPTPLHSPPPWATCSPGRSRGWVSKASFSPSKECAAWDSSLAGKGRRSFTPTLSLAGFLEPLPMGQSRLPIKSILEAAAQQEKERGVKTTESWEGGGAKHPFPTILPQSHRIFQAMIFMDWVPSGQCWGVGADVCLFQVDICWPQSSLIT